MRQDPDEGPHRWGLWLAAAALVLCAAAGEQAWHRMPSCEDPHTLDDLVAHVRADRHLGGLIASDVTTLHGRLFARRSCSVLLTEFRGNIDLSGHAWMRLLYTVPPGDPPYQDAGTALPTTTPR